MTEFVEWLRLFIFHYLALEYVIIFLVAGLGGEFGVIALGFLSAQGVMPVLSFFILSFLGVFFSDILWFLLGRTIVFDKIISHRYASGALAVITKAIIRLSKENNFITLIIAKFLIGGRVLLIMHTSRTNIGLKHFVLCDILAVFVWLMVVAPIGFISGLGFTYLSGIFENLYSTISLVLLFIMFIFIIQLQLKKILTEKNT